MKRIKDFLVFINESQQKVIYYTTFKEKDKFKVHLTGDTFDIKDFLKNKGFVWDAFNKAWVLKEPLMEGEIKKLIFILFEIQEMGIKISPSQHQISMNNIFDEFPNKTIPEIPEGKPKKNKIYIKDFHYYAPMTKVSGGGTKYIKPLLYYFGFEFNFNGYIYQRVCLFKEERNELIDILKSKNYDVIEQDEE